MTKNEERCKQGRRRESNREIRLRVLVGMGDYMKEKKRLISKSGNPSAVFSAWFGAEHSLLSVASEIT